MKQLHANELLELEKLKVRGEDIDRLRKEKAAVERTLYAKRTAKKRLVWQVHTLKQWIAKQKSSGIDPMEKYGTIRCGQIYASRNINCDWIYER